MANHAPTITTLTVTPTTGMQQLTTFTMSAVAADSDNDTLTYTWDFGDNTTGTGTSVTKIYATGGSRTVALTVNDGRSVIHTATATGSQSITVRSLTGTWRLEITKDCSYTTHHTLDMTLTQTNGTVLGPISIPDGFCSAPAGTSGKLDPAEPGTVDANGYVVMRIKLGAYVDTYFRGTLNDAGTAATGNMSNSGLSGPATLTKLR